VVSSPTAIPNQPSSPKCPVCCHLPPCSHKPRRLTDLQTTPQFGTPEFHSAVTYSNQHDDLLNSFDFEQQQLDGFHQDNSFFGFDFTLFENVGLEKSIFDYPAPSLTSSSPSTSSSSDSSATLASDYLVDFTSESFTEDTLTTSTTIPRQQAPSSAAFQGSEGLSASENALTPPAEPSLGLPGAYPRQFFFHCQANTSLDLTPHTLGGSSANTTRLPTPPSTGLPGLPLFPPLGTPTPPTCFTPSSLTPEGTAESVTSSRKRKASELTSPRPKELVETEIHSDDDDKDVRRKRNTAAARRYRQKKQDRMKELEEELEESKKREEAWRMEAQKQRMEAEKWHTMVQFMRENMGVK
jgi:hypothetical protein